MPLFRWTSRNCALSCNDCDGKRSAAILKETEYLLQDDGDGCMDLNADCFERIRHGSCLRGDPYMVRECRRSCRFCEPDQIDPDVEQAHFFSQMLSAQERGDTESYVDMDVCIDLVPHCRSFKRKNGCEKEKP